ncbi:PQQ-dependent sugar dehydrogenase [Filimonas effusa]|nr:PQQ-dependent sugar dehydrogenase [Filimonas effusa]
MFVKNTFFIILLTCISVQVKAQKTVTGPYGELFSVCTVASGLSDPWEITVGPDQYLWVTESRGYRVCRIHPLTSIKSVVLNLDSAKNFPRYDLLPEEQSGGKPWPQSGLMGMAIHPNFAKEHPYVYLAWLSSFAGADSTGKGCLEGNKGCFFKTTIARFSYNASTQRLEQPVIICDTIPGSNDHNGGRLLIAPVNNNYYLFYTVGDMGAGQYGNAGRSNHAQQTGSYEGKVLRFCTIPDNDTGRYDKWIPNDNPFNSTVQNAVWSYGHRNAQGICQAVIQGTNRIYAAEHGPFSDDEINLVEKGMNYGHPLVIGYNDNNYNQLAAGTTRDSSLPGKWHSTYPLINDEHANANTIGSIYRDPLLSLYPVSNDSLTKLFGVLQEPGKEMPDWPSEAPSSIEVYQSTAIPGWHNSLLVTTLKGGKLIRLLLSKNGDKIKGEPLHYFNAKVRYRDIAVSPDGNTIYLATDSSTVSSGPTQHSKAVPEQRGTIIAFKYIGQQQSTPPEQPQENDPGKVPAAINHSRDEQ